MATRIDRATLTVVAATRLEVGAVRAAAPGVRVVESGVGFARRTAAGDGDLGQIVVTCGLAGALRPELPTGCVLIPDRVLRPTGEVLACDEELVRALEEAARRLGFRPLREPLVTSQTLVTADERRRWARRGYAAADMETGLVRARRVATVRVILDTPERELSPAWLRPQSALLHPPAWRQALWLAREGPRCSRRAASVLAAALDLS